MKEWLDGLYNALNSALFVTSLHNLKQLRQPNDLIRSDQALLKIKVFSLGLTDRLHLSGNSALEYFNALAINI